MDDRADTDDEIYILSPDEIIDIKEGIEDIKKGNFLIDLEANREIEPILKK